MYPYLKVDRKLNRFVFLCHGFRFRTVSAFAIDLAGIAAIHGFAIVARVLTKIRSHFHQQYLKSISHRLTPSKPAEQRNWLIFPHNQYCSDPVINKSSPQLSSIFRSIPRTKFSFFKKLKIGFDFVQSIFLQLT